MNLARLGTRRGVIAALLSTLGIQEQTGADSVCGQKCNTKKTAAKRKTCLKTCKKQQQANQPTVLTPLPPPSPPPPPPPPPLPRTANFSGSGATITTSFL